MREGMSAVATNLIPLLRYQGFGGSGMDKEAAAAWLSRRGLVPSQERIFVTPGAHPALLAIFGLLARPGDTVLSENITYPGMRSIAAQLRLNLSGLPMDDEGILPDALADYPEVSGSIVNYGLIDFAGMCMTSDADQKRICTAVRLAIERHEPRLHKVTATLQPRKGAINRVDFVITAQLKNAPVADPMHFNAVFQPSLQRYSIQSVRNAP